MKFSIVTPTCNSERFLAETIASVLGQEGDFDIEHIIVDNLSDDRTPEIVNYYQENLDRYRKTGGKVTLRLERGRDRGMYDAINRGFGLATGDIQAWINSDDLYHHGAFASVQAAFDLDPRVQCVKGITSYIDENGREIHPGTCFLYSRELTELGLYGREAYFIQQEGMFWRSALWQAVGGVDCRLRLAGDYALWMKFARLTPIYALNARVSAFRKVKGQLSEDLSAYRREQAQIKVRRTPKTWLLGKYFSGCEPRLPRWISFVVFRLFCPLTSLYYIDCTLQPLKIRTSFAFVVPPARCRPSTCP